jgi:hypothetical protein
VLEKYASCGKNAIWRHHRKFPSSGGIFFIPDLPEHILDGVNLSFWLKKKKKSGLELQLQACDKFLEDHGCFSGQLTNSAPDR